MSDLVNDTTEQEQPTTESTTVASDPIPVPTPWGDSERPSLKRKVAQEPVVAQAADPTVSIPGNPDNCPGCGFDVVRPIADSLRECVSCHTVFSPDTPGQPIGHALEDGVVVIREQLSHAISLEAKLRELHPTLKDGETVVIVDTLRGYRDVETLVRQGAFEQGRAVLTRGGVINAARHASFEIVDGGEMSPSDPSPKIIIRKPVAVPSSVIAE